jgi:hypothetical protein
MFFQQNICSDAYGTDVLMYIFLLLSKILFCVYGSIIADFGKNIEYFISPAMKLFIRCTTRGFQCFTFYISIGSGDFNVFSFLVTKIT